MKKKMLAGFTCLLLIFSWVEFVGYGFAAEFGPDSANITNRYAGLDAGKKGQISLGCSGSDSQGQIFYVDKISQEEVDGVNCLKTNFLSQNELITVWFAQDTDGTVWALKVFIHSKDQTFTLGDGIESPFMPANPTIGRAGLTVPESDQYFCRIVETNVNVPQTCWGIGPVEGFNECIKIECGTPDTINEEEYYCADFGQVKYSRTNGGEHELKEIIEETCPSDLDNNGVTDGIDLFIFSSGFGKTCR